MQERGRRVEVPHLVVRWADNGLVHPRLGLAVSRRPALTVVSGLVGKGAPPPQPRVPRRGLIRPTSSGFVLLVRLLPGQVPEHFVKVAPAMAEESSLKEGAREVGRAVGTAAREVGEAGKKVGKAVAGAAKEGAEVVKEGAKEAKRAMKQPEK